MPAAATESGQRSKGSQHLLIREVGIAPAGVRQHEYQCVADALMLQTKRDWAFDVGKQCAEYGDAYERNDVGLVAKHLPAQAHAPGDVFPRLQRIDPCRRPGHDVGDAEAPFGQPVVVFVTDTLGHEPRFEQQLPESIREAGKVMAGERGTDARIDADEQHANAGPNAIAKRWQATNH